MNTYTLQINTSGAWRNVCPVAVNTPRLERLKHAIGTLMELEPGAKFCLLEGTSNRYWFELDPDTGRATLRQQLGEGLD